jgi:murein DD-endopeptidase MepM/ murein hydrolase activator NlpD
MSTTCPEPAGRPRRGWAPFALALLLTVGAVAPVAAPAAVAERPDPSTPPPSTAAPSTAVPDRPRVPPLWMPLTGAVVRGFDARAGPYGPGHRGIDVAASVGEVVRAPAAGKVVFAGPVAGTTWVSIQVAPGVVATVGPLHGELVSAGRVGTGTPVGRVALGHAPGSVGGAATLHLSLRVNGEYLDPLAYLVDRPRPRLVPLPAPGGRPAP